MPRIIMIKHLSLFATLYLLSFMALAQTPIAESDKGQRQYADFYHVLYTYWLSDYANTLGLIDKAKSKHSFSALTAEDRDRLVLVQGASQLYIGLYNKAQKNFLALLDRSTSDYVQAQAWYWLAKAGFQNQQPGLSEQAYVAIQQKELIQQLETDQWQELVYLAAYTRMQNQQEWQTLFDQLDNKTIYPAYLQANFAVNLFNQQGYEQAQSIFIAAKQSLITHQNAQQNLISNLVGTTQSFLYYLAPWKWFSSDPNQLAQQKLQQAQDTALQQEQNALFDKINMYLGYSLLQQQDDLNALAVIKQVSAGDADAKQALLTLGWTYAQQNNWQPAMQTWRFLEASDRGYFNLQANYATAYAYHQQGEFVDAYYALDKTVNKIAVGIELLEEFASIVQQGNFLDSFNQRWPVELNDLKQSFLNGSFSGRTVDTEYYLLARVQAREILDSLLTKREQLDILNSMLKERQLRFEMRADSLELTLAKQSLADAKSKLNRIGTLLSQDQHTHSPEFLISMLSNQQMQSWQRLQKATKRHKRLLNQPPKGRPLKQSYAERLNRLQGILQWHMDDNFIKERWRHSRLLEQAELTYHKAQASLASVQMASNEAPELIRDKQRIQMLKEQINTHLKDANAVFERADLVLMTFLNEIISARKAELEQQWVSARLARIRLQDLQGEQENTFTGQLGGTE